VRLITLVRLGRVNFLSEIADKPLIMTLPFEYVVTSFLPREWVWKVFSDISLWPQISNVYVNVKWMGEPWKAGSRLRAEVRKPEPIEFQYTIESCTPGESVRYIAHGEVLGFAIARETVFESIEGGTVIRSRAYCVGSPTKQMKADASVFLKGFTTQWYDSLSRYCDLLAMRSFDSKANLALPDDQSPS
jgi:hypothetical protein